MKKILFEIKDGILCLFCDIGLWSFIVIPLLIILFIVFSPFILLSACFSYLNDKFKLKFEDIYIKHTIKNKKKYK